MADNKKMSVEEVLAACRKMDGGAAGGAKAPAAVAPATEAPVAAAPAETAAAPKPAAVKPGAMSVADIMAAARAGKSPAAPAKEAGGEAGAAKPAGAAATAVKPKPADGKATPANSPAALDTASILAAARGKVEKPGPITKAEAAAKGKPDTDAKKKLEVPPMPSKPAFAMPKPAAALAADTRRGFFSSLGAIVAGSSLAVAFSSLAVTNLLWSLGLARFMFPNVLIEPPTKFKVGFPDALAPGQVDERYKAQFGVWIVKYEYEGQPQIFALKSVCTHLGCTPSWLEAEQKFKCPCHGSGFYKDGVNFEGPAPRPLERYAIKLADDGQLEVDKSRVFHEETGQWADVACFVNV
jgi:cytochrome b6-f complex iron-sulfur subunit